jgi:lysophospholipase L1-like esterase
MTKKTRANLKLNPGAANATFADTQLLPAEQFIHLADSMATIDDDLGAAVSTLTTTAKTVVGSINEIDAQIGAAASSSGTLGTSIDTDGTLKAGAVDATAVIADAVVTAAKLDTSAVPIPNMISQAFNWTPPGVDWGGRRRWLNGSSLTRSITGGNLYTSPIATMPNATSEAGIVVYLDEMDAQNSETIYIAVRVRATAADTYRLKITGYDLFGTTETKTAENSASVVFSTNQTQTLTHTYAINSTQKSIEILVERVAGSGTAQIISWHASRWYAPSIPQSRADGGAWNNFNVGDGPYSFVTADLMSVEWQCIPAANVARRAVADATYPDAVHLNYAGDLTGSLGDFALEAFFAAPAGVSSVRCSVWMKLPTGVASSDVRIALINAETFSGVANTACELTADWAEYTVSGNVTAGTKYTFEISPTKLELNQQALVANPQCRPATLTGAVPFYIYPFQRYACSPKRLHDNATGVWQGDYWQVNPASRFVATTSAMEIAVEYYSNIHGTYPDFAKILVLVGGRIHAVIAPTANNKRGVQVVMLPGGVKTIEIVSSFQSKPSSTVIGTFPIAVYAPAQSQFDVVPAAGGGRRLVVYGDSIASGANSEDESVPAAGGWNAMLRRVYPGSVVNFAHGYRALNDDCVDAAARIAFARELAQVAPSEIWIAIGTNDYGLEHWSAANFGTAYADLLDKLHAALPGAKLWCQTPIDRTTETELTGGYGTLGDYRTQITTAVSSRTAYAELVDGTAILSTSDLDDGVHPTADGHGIYFEAVRAELGA